MPALATTGRPDMGDRSARGSFGAAFRPRRPSLSSISSRGPGLDKEALSQALDEIHGTASKQETLTSFSDFDGGGPSRAPGPKELVAGGIAGLYSRFRQSVTGVPDAVRPGSSGSYTKAETASVKSGTSGQPRSRLEIDVKASPAASSRLSRDLSEPTSAPLSPKPPRDSSKPLVETHPASPQASRKSTASTILLQGSARPSDRASDPQVSAPTRDAQPRVEANTNNLQRVSTSERRKSGTRDRSKERANIDDIPSTSLAGAESNEKANKRLSVQSRKSIGSSDTNAEKPTSPDRSAVKSTATSRESSQSRNTSLGTAAAADGVGASQLRPLTRVSEKALPSVNVSRTSSGLDVNNLSRPSTNPSSGATTPRAEYTPNLNVGFRRPTVKVADGHRPHTVVPAHLKRRVVSKEFWMKDENARDCFYCGDTFSTFRRKHHCRTCGQIFDAKCTILVSGRPFDLPGTLRLCRPCEDVIYGSGDDSTVFSEDDEERHNSPMSDAKTLSLLTEQSTDDLPPFQPGASAIATPFIGIPASRRNREAKRRSAVIEFDANPVLARPGSSRSLKSLAGRPRSSSHRRQLSKHQYTRSMRQLTEERGPFQQESSEPDGRHPLPAFHNDNIIDPDLAPFMSDGGSDDDQASIFTVVHGGSQPSSYVDHDQPGLASFMNGNQKKSRSRTQSDRPRDDPARVLNRNPSRLRKRNPSIASINFARASPRRSRSQTFVSNNASDNFQRSNGSDGASNHDLVTQGNLEGNIKRSSTMHGTDAPKVELNSASLQHVRLLLVQLLHDHCIQHSKAWAKALMPILLQCTDDVDPDVQHGDDMDIRNYVKLKKVPGGRPGDTSYVSGVVFSRNVALKGMRRSFTKPRIVIVTFAIEYARHNTHFMSLDPILAQEHEYLRNLVGRIVALRPHVLLVQRNVSGLALQMLHDAGITVVTRVKESVLAAVARVTKTIMIKTIDKLSIDPSHLGSCDSFDIKTYINGGIKKTYIFISGCQPSLGCTIVLRGSDTESLRRVKRITEFMCYVVYNLKLETCLMRDEFISIPSCPEGSEANAQGEHQSNAVNGSESPAGDLSSPAGKVDLPCSPSQYHEMAKSSQTKLMSSSPFVRFSEPHLLRRALEQESSVARHQKLLDQFQQAELVDKDDASDAHQAMDFEMVQPEMLLSVDPQNVSRAMRSFLKDIFNVQYQRALTEFTTKRRQWDSFNDSNNGNPFDPFQHQNIFVLHSLVSSVTSAPCAGPEVIGLSFYADYEQEEMNYQDDCTLGQFVEDICTGAGTACRTCGRKMLEHHRQYVHGEGQLTVSVTRYPSKLKGLQNTVLMWSTCKICNLETTVIPMSNNTWKYSLGKYLELSFWSTPLRPRAGLCPHDVHKEFVRCFGFQDQCVRVQYDKIEIYEVVVPSPNINWAIHSDITLKNKLYSDCVNKLSAFISSIKSRLESINLSPVAQDKIADASTALEKLMQRADHDHDEVLSKIQIKYMSSRYFEFLPLNRAIRFMDEKALAWDDAFGEFERNYFPSETDIRNLATLQLKKLFLDRSEVAGSEGSDLDGVELKDASQLRLKSVTMDMLQSEKAQHMLTSVLEEQTQADDTQGTTIAFPRAHLGSPDTRSPNMTHSEIEKAVEQDNVKHLDLAVVSSAPEPMLPLGQELLPTDQSPSGQAPQSDAMPANSSEEPLPLNATLVEKIEQIRAAAVNAPADDMQLDSKPAESKIPRPQKKGGSRPQMPSLIRARSSPTNPHRRTTEQPGQTSGSVLMEVDTETDEEDAQMPQGGPAKAPESKLIERLSRPAASRHTSMIPRSVPSTTANDNATRVSALAKHFEQLSREFEKERLRERKMRAARMRQSRASHLPSSQPVVEVFRDASEAVSSKPENLRVDGQKRPNIKRATSAQSYQSQTNDPIADADEDHTDTYTDNERASNIYSHGTTSDTEIEGETTDNEMSADGRQSRVLDPGTASNPPTLTPSSLPDLELPLPKHEKSSLMKMLSSFWSERSASGWAPLEYPLNPTEHVFDDSDIVVREDEPSSVIALALSSNDYLKKVVEFRQGGRNRSMVFESSGLDGEAMDQAAIEASLISETGTHMKYSFGHNQVRAQCKIFYAESFDALRRKCGVSDRFVESLSRSIKWDSKGGKTKSLFLKTLDDRFVIKSLQEIELKAFTRFAPDYFAFMSQTLFHGVPSVIAKMFGLFQVMIKNPATGVEFSSYLLVMENLFYDHKPTRRFDLKGSMRNRKIESTGQPDEVLLDENLVETIFETPLFVREHARKLVKASVWNDTMFLCRQNVMDYSLMAGFDDASRRLFVGIIDCIRTYTWDKKLESWIKDRGKNKPTITSPRDYRNRFRVSMMQYVLQSPNVYHEFSRSVGVGQALPEREERAELPRGKAGGEQQDGVAALVDEVAMREIG